MPITELPFGLPGRIFRSPMPFHRCYDPDGAAYDALEREGITTIVVLAEEHECREKSGRDLLGLYRKDGYEVEPFPIEDFCAPDVLCLEKKVRLVAEMARQGKHLAVHCSYGQGRTGTFMAALAKYLRNCSAEEAIAWVRQFVPGAVERPVQKRAVEQAFSGASGDQR